MKILTNKSYNELMDRIKELEENSPERLLEHIVDWAKKLNIDLQDEEYQSIAKLILLNTAGKSNPLLKAFAEARFFQVNDTDIVNRMIDFKESRKGIMSNKQIQDKGVKK